MGDGNTEREGVIPRKQQQDIQAALNEHSTEKIVVVGAEPDGKCELCGAVAETRPYGPKGEEICYRCGRKDPVTTERRMREVMLGGK